MAADCLDPYLIKTLNELFPILRVYDSLHRRAQNLNAIPFQNTVLVQFNATIEGCLAAKGEEDAVRPFFGNDTFYKIGRDRQEIDIVGYALGCLHGCYIGVYKHCLDTLFFERLQCLTA